MVKTETDERLGGIELKVIRYYRNSDPQQDSGEFTDDGSRIKQEMGLEGNGYRHRNGKVKAILGSYGQSQIFLSYLCDDGEGHMQDAKIITASVAHGGEAKDLIEHFLNSTGTIIGTALQRCRSLEDVDFELQESGDFRRILNLSTGSQYPLSFLNERYVIFVAEKNGQNASDNSVPATEPYTQITLRKVHEPLKWYQRLAMAVRDYLKI